MSLDLAPQFAGILICVGKITDNPDNQSKPPMDMNEHESNTR